MKNQIQIEEENRLKMFNKSVNEFNKQVQSGLGGSSSSLVNVLAVYSNELSNKLEEYTQEILAGKAKQKPLSAKILTLVNPKIVSFYTIKTMLNSVGHKNSKLSNIVNELARVLETEYKLIKLEEVDQANFSKLNRFLEKSVYQGDRRIKVINDLMNKYSKDIAKNYKTNFLKLAMLCIQMSCEIQPMYKGVISPLLATIYTEEKFKGAQILMVMPWVKEWVMSQFEQGNYLTTYNTCLIEEPKDWQGIHGGGFHTDFFKYKLIRTDINDKEFLGVDLSKTLEAVNRLQKTKWRVNIGILEVIRNAMDMNKGWGGLPTKVELNKIPYPYPNTEFSRLSEQEKVRVKEWRKLTANDYSSKISEDSKFMSLFRTVSEAERFKNFEYIYFSYFLDFRGRAYPVASNLNPQGTDFVKALLEFGEGKPINTKESELFFFSQGANSFGHGNDKKSLKEKYDFIKKHSKEIIASASNPYDESGFWMSADEDPWLFLAFCMEYKNYVEDGEKFKSRLVISMDGSCNGLQHLSAMLFDEVGGKSVNLTNNKVKQDIYTDVLNVVISKLNSSSEPVAKQLLALGMDRKITKRPVMIVPYSGTRTAVRSYIHDELIAKKGDTKLGDNYNEGLNLLTDMVWESIGEVIVKGREIMDFFNSLARDMVRETRSTNISWTTPNGFKVIQKCVKQDSHQLKTMIGDNVLLLRFNKDTDKTDIRKHGFGIAPNLIHSLDACHLQTTINKLGDISFGMIHDSFGTHANTAPDMFRVLREVFVELYKKGDIITNFINQQQLNINDLTIPEKGNLDINEVLDSEYFFI